MQLNYWPIHASTSFKQYAWKYVKKKTFLDRAKIKSESNLFLFFFANVWTQKLTAGSFSSFVSAMEKWPEDMKTLFHFKLHPFLLNFCLVLNFLMLYGLRPNKKGLSLILLSDAKVVNLLKHSILEFFQFYRHTRTKMSTRIFFTLCAIFGNSLSKFGHFFQFLQKKGNT